MILQTNVTKQDSAVKKQTRFFKKLYRIGNDRKIQNTENNDIHVKRKLKRVEIDILKTKKQNNRFNKIKRTSRTKQI